MSQIHDTGKALDRLLEVTTLLQADMEQALVSEGLTVARAHLLWILHHGGPTTQRAVAHALGVSPRNVTGLVDGLAASAHVTREPHPTDRRATLVTLTPKGAELMARLSREHENLGNSLFRGFTKIELEHFVRGLERVNDQLRSLLDGAA